MCDVCCASVALQDTAERGEALFVWDPKTRRGRLENNPDAPPVSRPREVPEGWPHVYVQTEPLSPERMAELAGRLHGKRRAVPGAEGPGRARFRLDPADPWSPWVETDCVSNVMMALGVDLRWTALDKGHPVRSRDTDALYAKVEAFVRERWAAHSGYEAGRALLHAGKVVADRVNDLQCQLYPRGPAHHPAAAFAPGGPLEGIRPEDAPAWFDGVLSVLRRPSVRRVKRSGRRTAATA